MPSLQLYSVFLISLIVRIETRLIRNRFHNRFRTWVQIDQQQHRHQHIWALLVAGSNTWQNYRHQRSKRIPVELDCSRMFLYETLECSTISRVQIDQQQHRHQHIWALLVAGSNTWQNYRHQADVCHAYHILRNHGVPEQRIITMMYDDIANNSHDHGGYGLIGFPFETLSVVDLNNTLIRMHRAKHFKHLVFYMEACESGSMFESLPDNVDIYANTAANALESSFACYCDNGMGLPCLGDEFSVNWMEDSDTEDLRSETLQRQYETVRDKTQLSDVMQYGNLSIADAVVGAFQGWRRSPRQIIYDNKELDGVMWPVREIPLLSLERVLDTEVTSNGKEAIQRKIQRLLKKRDYLDSFVEALVDDLIPNRVIRERVLNDHPDLLTQPLCFDTVVKMFSRVCFDFSRNPYALKFSYVLANLCEELIDTTLIVNRMVDICEEVEITGVH
uniref:Legumain n=1 Tax=Ascaris lumbricoides TaxID=6252 RepID=A0A0M3HZ97_ASCLU